MYGGAFSTVPAYIGDLFGIRTYSMSEGWAHYTEEMMWDAGVGDGDPKVHVGQLQNALLRNVRFISAIGMHTKGMTVEESRKMFLEKGMQDEGKDLTKIKLKKFQKTHFTTCTCPLCVEAKHQNDPHRRGLDQAERVSAGRR